LQKERYKQYTGIYTVNNLTNIMETGQSFPATEHVQPPVETATHSVEGELDPAVAQKVAEAASAYTSRVQEIALTAGAEKAGIAPEALRTAVGVMDQVVSQGRAVRGTLSPKTVNEIRQMGGPGSDWDYK
jgi:hypothetical protein